MKIKIENLTLNNNTRILCISDIHGNFLYLKELLNKVNYNEDEDYLFILGDMIEKGKESLKVIRFLKKLKNCYMLMGNCEYERIKPFIHNDPLLLKEILNYPNYNSIYKEMVAELNIDYKNYTDDDLYVLLHEKFKEEINFLMNLPHVIETENYRFAHAGTLKDNILDNNLDDILRLRDFDTLCKGLKKWCVVGHYPTVNYSKNIPNFNPLINEKKKIISIDGGNEVSPYGQLNCFIILPNNTFSFTSYEKKIKITCPFNQKGSIDSFYLSFMDAKVKIIGELNDNNYLVKSKKGSFAIAKEEICYINNDSYVFDYTNYFINVHKLDKVYLYKQTPFAYLVKKDGILGWLRKDN